MCFSEETRASERGDYKNKDTRGLNKGSSLGKGRFVVDDAAEAVSQAQDEKSKHGVLLPSLICGDLKMMAHGK